jgi:hypothetical protein
VDDLTIIHTTLNKLPRKWQDFYKDMLLEAADGAPILTLSKEPMDWGINVIQTEPEGLKNIYFQMLKGAKLATTPYVAIAEDDTVYPPKHFKFRPPLDTIACNYNRWAVLTWRPKFYFLKYKPANCTMIAPRLELIDALEERLARPVFRPLDPVDNKKEKVFHLKLRKYMKFYTDEPIVNLNHIFSHNDVEARKKKKAKAIRCYDLPRWGHVKDFIKHYE